MEVEDYERSSAAALRLQQWFRRDFQRLLRRRRAGQRIAAGCRQMLMVYVTSALLLLSQCKQLYFTTLNPFLYLTLLQLARGQASAHAFLSPCRRWVASHTIFFAHYCC